MIEWLAIGLALFVIAAVLAVDYRHGRRARQRRADAAFFQRALDAAQRHRRRRPKADPRIQRRRYGQG